MKNLKSLLGIAMIFLAPIVWAKPSNVVTTVTELAYITKHIGDNEVEVSSLLDGTENPHYIDAVPQFIQRVSQADAVVVVGLDLEIGWAPKVLARSGKADVQPGGKNYCEVGKSIQVLDKPTGAVDRSMGDVHPAGNPHFWISPSGMIQAANPIAELLIGMSPEKAALFTKNKDLFVKRMEQLAARNQKKIDGLHLSGSWLMEYHKEFSYLLNQYKIVSFGSVEEKPGVAPSAGRIAQVSLAAKSAGVKVILAAEYSPKKTLQRLTEISGIPVVVIPTSIQPGGKFSDYETLQDHIVDSIVEAVKGASVS